MISNFELANGREWWIAGGWAACPQLASDQDVWISTAGEDLVLAKQDILKQFPQIDPDVLAPVIDENYETLGILVLRVGRLDNRHIMVTNEISIPRFLDAFDISTHQCALTSDMQFVKGGNWTPITRPPVQLRDTQNTNARMVKIAERYGQLAPTYRQHGYIFGPMAIVPEPESVPF